MRTLFALLSVLAWALWLGGLVTLFILVMTLFSEDHAAATKSAPHLFLVFERYQLILAAIVLTATVGWWINTRSRELVYFFIFLALAAFGSVVTPMYLSRQMEILRGEGKTQSPEFKKLHNYSMTIYIADTALLAIGGFPLFLALRRKPADQQSPTTSNPPQTLGKNG